MPVSAKFFSVLFLSTILTCAAWGIAPPDGGTVDLSNSRDLEARKPILIAHRGGVVTDRSPECSFEAIRLAAKFGYDMVELDVRQTSDLHPVVFHDSEMTRATGREGRIEDLSLEEAKRVRFARGGETIHSLEEALSLCRELNLGVMLDVKTDGSPPFFERVLEALEKEGLLSHALAISSRPSVREAFAGKVMLRVLDEDVEAMRGGDREACRGMFWFGQPREFPLELIDAFHDRGVLILPGVNTFRYPKSKNREEERRDIERLLEAGVDGFQIDSVYQQYFGIESASER